MESCLKTILIFVLICFIIPIIVLFFSDMNFSDSNEVNVDTIVLVETVYIEKQTPKVQKAQTAVKDIKPIETTKPTIEPPTPIKNIVETPPPKKEKNRQYIEVKGPLGDVELYHGMPKEEVRNLLGKPNNSSMMEIGGDIHENWTYKTKGILFVEFKNGKLTSISSY